MSKTIGYIVTGKVGPKRYDPNAVPEGSYKGTLGNGGPIALFSTRAKAKGAIERTNKYAKQKGYEDNDFWVGNLRPRRVEKAE